MKILIISVVFPYPIDAGGSAGTFKVTDHLRKNHDVTFISLYASPENRKKLSELWPGVKLITPDTDVPEAKVSTARKLYNLLRPAKEPDFEERCHRNMLLYSTDLVNCYFGEVLALVQKELETNSFDLIQVEYIEFAPFVYFLPENTSKVFIHHELRYKRIELEYKTLSNPSPELRWKIQTTKELEVALMNRYDKVLTVSEQDAAYLLEDGVHKEKLEVSPSPVELARRSVNIPFKFENRIIYLGPEKHYPNLDAVEWFLQNCWPAISTAMPQLSFEIVGKWSEEYKARHQDKKNVRFLGFVEDLEAVMTGAIMIVPLRIVSGMRMKILEAVSWNVPIISTSAGAEGLPMEHEKNCLIADDAGSFIGSVLGLAGLPELQNRLVEESGKLILDKYSKELCGKLREQHFEALLKTV